MGIVADHVHAFSASASTLPTSVSSTGGKGKLEVLTHCIGYEFVVVPACTPSILIFQALFCPHSRPDGDGVTTGACGGGRREGGGGQHVSYMYNIGREEGTRYHTSPRCTAQTLVGVGVVIFFISSWCYNTPEPAEAW